MPPTVQPEQDNERSIATPISPEPTLTPTPTLTHPSHQNYRITDETHLGEGGAKTHIIGNIVAIRLLKKLESEERSPTPDEQHTLARYVGWGGLSQVFDERNNQTIYASARESLHELLTPSELASARASTTNAHYTSETVITAMYEGLNRLGFSGGAILEPSMGVGNFYGLLPDNIASNPDTRLTGVELDSISGRIARQLYPQARIHVQGFEETDIRDNSMDVVVSNVPFGAYKLADPRYDKRNFFIHDYFVAKSIDTVKPGGIVAVVTSKGTLDKSNDSVRRYIAERAELVGAVRLPNNAFRQNAGTEVTTDILFLQKRERPIALDEKNLPEWIHTEKTVDGVPVNAYYIENPEMILGRMVFDKSMYGNETETACVALEGADLEADLRIAIQRLPEGIFGIVRDDNAHTVVISDIDNPEKASEEPPNTIPDPTQLPKIVNADPSVKNYTYTLYNNALYYREGPNMLLQSQKGVVYERIRGMMAIRDTVRELIDIQLSERSALEFDSALSSLNTQYDAFIAKYGNLNSRSNTAAFRKDVDCPLLCSLEEKDREGAFSKAAFFFKRTIRPYNAITHTDTVIEALKLSLNEQGRVDADYMAGLTQKSGDDVIRELSEHGLIFQNPRTSIWETADAYLSGNVRDKLREAEFAVSEHDTFATEGQVNPYTANVEALRAVQPPDLQAGDIEVRLGSTWIPASDVRQFVIDTLGIRAAMISRFDVKYSEVSDSWSLQNDTFLSGSFAARNTWGTSRANACYIIEQSLNMRSVRVTDRQDDGTYILNSKETIAAQEKQQQLQEAFKEWIFGEPKRRERLLKLYNEKFNSIRLRTYDGAHLDFPGMNPELQLKPHQTSAVARILYGGNTLLAHCVGAGKTYEMAAAVMEMKRIGLAHKPMIVVPNHLIDQWGAEFMRLYPSANLLLATKQDFEKSHRQRFCARIATGEYDAVIIGHSSFERIPLSKERREGILSDQISEMVEGIREAKESSGDNWTIKQMERTRKSLETELKKLQALQKKDDVVDFEQLGVDALFVDEAHAFKNMFLSTKMNRVAGIATSKSQRASDLYGKIQYIQEQTPGRNTVFATGTPISNTMCEMFTMQRYLQKDALDERGLRSFDSWASTFGQTVTSLELSPTGTGFRTKERFSKFFNLPELLTMYRMVADVQTADMLKLDVPLVKGGKPTTIVTTPSEELALYVDSLSERADQCRGGDPRKDNILKIVTDGRKAALDMRLIDPNTPDHPDSKINKVVENVHRIWSDTTENRSAQLLFSDLGTPSDKGFNVYDDIKRKLIQMGVPAEEIAYIHDAKTDKDKADLFAKVRDGDVRVLIGSTAKMGAGTNAQKRLIALHHVDVPWRPADVIQREGRIIRQGNDNPEVEIYRYATEKTFDSYSWQILENKQKFISQVMTGETVCRSAGDIDEAVLSYAEIKALATGNPLIQQKMETDMEIARLQVLKSAYLNQRYSLQDSINIQLPTAISLYEEKVVGLEKDIVRRDEHDRASGRTARSSDSDADNNAFIMTVKGIIYTTRKEAGEALIKAAMPGAGADRNAVIGSYRGFDLRFGERITLVEMPKLVICGASETRIDMSVSEVGNTTRLDNAINGLESGLEDARFRVSEYTQRLADAKVELDKPFARAGELDALLRKQSELNSKLGIGAKDDVQEIIADEPKDRDEDKVIEEREDEPEMEY